MIILLMVENSTHTTNTSIIIIKLPPREISLIYTFIVYGKTVFLYGLAKKLDMFVEELVY